MNLGKTLKDLKKFFFVPTFSSLSLSVVKTTFLLPLTPSADMLHNLYARSSTSVTNMNFHGDRTEVFFAGQLSLHVASRQRLNTLNIQGAYKCSLTNFQEILTMYYLKPRRSFTWQAIQYQNAGEVTVFTRGLTCVQCTKNHLMCENYIANYKIFQEHQLNSRFSGVVDALT